MKKYYINIRNDIKIIWYAGILACYLFLIDSTVWMWSMHPVVGALWSIIPLFLVIATLSRFICTFTNYFTYNPETNEITLKRFRQRDRVINLSSVEKIVEKNNPDPFLGACSRKYSAPWVVKSRDGYDYFFIEQNDAVLEKFFAEHGIPTLPVREESTD